jgi:hypothetical protein
VRKLLKARMKTALYRIHRWLGVSLGILVTLWFASAFVMIYVGFPALTTRERLAGLDPLPTNAWAASPAQAFTATGLTSPPARVRLGTFLGRPVYHFRPADGTPWRTITADDGRPLPEVSAEDAVEVAQRFARSTIAARHDGKIELDLWTVSPGLQPFRPLHRIALNDADHTELYVSARTGEVVRDTTRLERILNFFGCVVHWIYPAWLRRHTGAWRLTIQILSGAAFLVPLTGLLIGLPRLRTAWRQMHGARRWHILVGGIFGIPALTWLASGFLSIRSAALFDDGEPTEAQHALWSGGPLDLDRFTRPWPAILRDLRSGPALEGECIQIGGKPFFLVHTATSPPQRIPADASSLPDERLASGTLRDQARQLLPNASVVAFETLDRYDAHYYSRRPGEDPRPLPVWRVRFNDPAQTWFHIDPASGKITERLTRRSRTYRWLFNGLHSFDWPWLAERRPLWDAVVLVTLGGGLGLCLLGLRLARRRISPRRASGPGMKHPQP